MNDDFKIVSEFCCHGKHMVTIRIGNAAHVISQEEWHQVYGRNPQDGWKKKVDWNRFIPRKHYKKKYVS